MLVISLIVPVAWLLGTFPSALLVARAHGRDILHEGSGNPGASNVARLIGWRAGALVLTLDFAKGAIAAGAGMVIGGRAGEALRERQNLIRHERAAAGAIWAIARRAFHGVNAERAGNRGDVVRSIAGDVAADSCALDLEAERRVLRRVERGIHWLVEPRVHERNHERRIDNGIGAQDRNARAHQRREFRA